MKPDSKLSGRCASTIGKETSVTMAVILKGACGRTTCVMQQWLQAKQRWPLSLEVSLPASARSSPPAGEDASFAKETTGLHSAESKACAAAEKPLKPMAKMSKRTIKRMPQHITAPQKGNVPIRARRPRHCPFTPCGGKVAATPPTGLRPWREYRCSGPAHRPAEPD